MGTRQHQRWENADGKEKIQLVQSEIRKGEEEVRAVRIAQMVWMPRISSTVGGKNST